MGGISLATPADFNREFSNDIPYCCSLSDNERYIGRTCALNQEVSIRSAPIPGGQPLMSGRGKHSRGARNASITRHNELNLDPSSSLPSIKYRRFSASRELSCAAKALRLSRINCSRRCTAICTGLEPSSFFPLYSSEVYHVKPNTVSTVVGCASAHGVCCCSVFAVVVS